MFPVLVEAMVQLPFQFRVAQLPIHIFGRVGLGPVQMPTTLLRATTLV
jgi:hypothetical protein